MLVFRQLAIFPEALNDVATGCDDLAKAMSLVLLVNLALIDLAVVSEPQSGDLVALVQRLGRRALLVHHRVVLLGHNRQVQASSSLIV